MTVACMMRIHKAGVDTELVPGSCLYVCVCSSIEIENTPRRQK
jgi:hypothetical protein